MLLPLNWLKQFIKINSNVDEIAGKLTLSGSEVEKIVKHDAGLSKVYVGQIKTIKPHPNADKLRLAYVDIGQNKLLEIVCGAPNIEAGQKVPVVMLGGSVPGISIEPRDIRGVKSQGMLCSQKELGLGDDHSGIFVLPPDAPIGLDVTKLLELNEPILELEITPNRADCFSVRGLAREVTALFGRKIQDTRYKIQESTKKTSTVLSVEVKDKDLCPKYMARVIEDVVVGSSPLWLQNKLRQVGIKSINNVVDVTNYVLMELGQPLHAFDFDLLFPSFSRTSPQPSPWKGEGAITVRRAKKGEKLLALDDKTYNLDDSMLVIADEKQPVAIAGVMGGKESGVTSETKTVILESAIFDPVAVRKTSKILGLRSESSARFEKGLDPAATEEALDQAAAMIAELSNGVILKGIVSVGAARRIGGRAIKISTTEITNLLGAEIKPQKIKSILQSLGFGVSGNGQNLNVKIPSWRADVSMGADIVEEIGRMVDYNTLPKTLPSTSLQSKPIEPLQLLRRNLRKYLTSAGYSEILTYSFYDEKLLNLSGVSEDNHIKVINPVNSENKFLRANLLPWMLSKLSQNSALLAREQFQLFEIGKVFVKPNHEKWQLAVGLIDTTASDEILYRRLRGIGEFGEVMIYPKGKVPNMRFRSSVGVLLVDLDELLKNMPDERRQFQALPFYPQVE
ncbi:MAG: phenylalanine--tRNA ligase subunit beta, partial [Patescibacteria group bacterium]